VPSYDFRVVERLHFILVQPPKYPNFQDEYSYSCSP